MVEPYNKIPRQGVQANVKSQLAWLYAAGTFWSISMETQALTEVLQVDSTRTRIGVLKG